jgi:hypothetical protein
MELGKLSTKLSVPDQSRQQQRAEMGGNQST